MFRKSTMLALAATVSLGSLALSSSSYAMSRLYVQGYVKSHNADNPGPGHVMNWPQTYRPPLQLRRAGTQVNVPQVGGLQLYRPSRTFNNPQVVSYSNPQVVHELPRWRRPYSIAPVVATGGIAATRPIYASTPAPTANQCLTKEYTPQGAVVFKDVCTNEMAMYPPGNALPAAEVVPQMPPQPSQQGYLQPQVQ